MMADHRLVPLHLGTMHGIDRSAFMHGTEPGIDLTPPCIAWVVTDGARAILVDAGPGTPDRAPGVHPRLTQTPDQTLTAALDAAGFAPTDLEMVVLSHLHWDHIGGLGEVPDVAVLVQRAELWAAVDPIAAQRSQYEVGAPGVVPVWTSALDRIELIDGDVKLWPGLRLISLPGHTPGSQGALASTDTGDHLVAGDAVPLRDNWSDDPAARIPNGIHTDLDAYHQTFDQIAALNANVLPAHDPSVLAQTQYPVVDSRSPAGDAS